jgi:hypothetical protein
VFIEDRFRRWVFDKRGDSAIFVVCHNLPLLEEFLLRTTDDPHTIHDLERVP